MYPGVAGVAPEGLPNPPVKCPWLTCVNGCGLAGMGTCLWGDWRRADCPEYERCVYPTGSTTPEQILQTQELEAKYDTP